MRKFIKWIVIGIGALLGLCLVVGVISNQTGGDKQTESAPKAVATATVRLTPTLIPLATATSLPPTATVAPTDGLTVTPEPAAAPDGEDVVYQAAIQRIAKDYQEILQGIGQQFTAAGSDTTLLLDNDWKTKTAIYLGMLKLSDGEIRALTPPAKYSATHVDLLIAADHFDQMADLSARGIDALDAAQIEQALQELKLGTAAIQSATTHIEQPDDASKTVEPTSSSVPAASGPTAAENGNLRAGPGTGYERSGSVVAGQPLQIVGRTPAGDWLQLAGGAWIAAFLVAGASDVPVAAVIPALPSKSVGIPVATPRGQPSAAASSCDCAANTLNCDDFAPWEAQACYLRCVELTGRDVHGLDRDNDGSACEWEY